MDKKEFVNKTVTIRKDQSDWLKRNRDVNLSGLVQKVIDERK